MSVGLAWWERTRSAPGTTCEQVLAEADRALYAAKAEGRNRVVAGSPQQGTAHTAGRA
jgi:PleD family two-component response regulator